MGLGTALAGRKSAKAQEEAAKQSTIAQTLIANAQMEENRRQYDLTRADQMPWINSGRDALGVLDRTATGDMSAFMASPDYNFRRSEGQRDIGSSFAARGGAASGNALRALSDFNQNLARGEFGDWWNRTANRAGVGQTAVQNVGAVGANMTGQNSNISGNLGQNVGANITAGGQARGSRLGQGWNSASNTAGFFFGNFGGGGRKPPVNSSGWSGPR